MMNYLPMIPPVGRSILHVLVIGRVSTLRQNIENIDAGYRYAEGVLQYVWKGESIIKRLGEQGSGMLVERQTILDACALIAEGWPDLVLMEDASKSYRNPRWIFAFFQDCADADIRVIAPGDGIDLYDDNWEVALGTAALRHGLHIPDTRRRVRRTSTDSFAHGGMVLKTRAGYRKLTKEEAASGTFGPKGLRIAKLPEWTEIYQKLRELVVRDRKGGAALAAWLNAHEPSIPVPPYCSTKMWTDRVVLDTLRDPILHGLRQFPKVRYEPLFKTGKHKRKPNPHPQSFHYPQLAHMTQEEWEEMNRILDEVGDQARGAQKRGTLSPRYRVPRSRTLAVLQHATCAACQSLLYPAGKGKLKCCRAGHSPDSCWNHVQIDVQFCRELLVQILLERIQPHPGAMSALMDSVWSEIEKARHRERRDVEQLDREIAQLKSQGERISSAIADGGKLQPLVEKLKMISASLKSAEKRLASVLVNVPQQRFPETKDQLQLDPQVALLELARVSYDFAELLRNAFPSLVVQPVQALDTAQVHPRISATLDLAALVPEQSPGPGSEPQQFRVDCFEPPEHIKHLNAVVETRAERLQRGEKASLDILAAELGIGRMTVKRAIAYQKLMQAEGLSEPYRELRSAPSAASRWKPRRSKSRQDLDAA